MTAADAALTALYTDHADRLRRTLRRMLRTEDAHLADDLVQTVYIQVWTQYLTRGITVRSPWGLLVTMARHRVADHYRAARPERPTDPTAPYGPLHQADARELVSA